MGFPLLSSPSYHPATAAPVHGKPSMNKLVHIVGFAEQQEEHRHSSHSRNDRPRRSRRVSLTDPHEFMESTSFQFRATSSSNRRCAWTSIFCLPMFPLLIIILIPIVDYYSATVGWSFLGWPAAPLLSVAFNYSLSIRPSLSQNLHLNVSENEWKVLSI